MRVGLVGLAAMMGCSGGQTDPDGVRLTADTASNPAPPADLAVTCGWHDGNELRIACTVDLLDPAPVAITFQVPEEGPRVLEEPVAARRHTLRLWDLPAETLITWTAVVPGTALQATGQVATGAGPVQARPNLRVSVAGPSSLDRLLVPWGCGGASFLTVIDRDGGLRWYHPLPSASIKGLTFSDRGTFLALVDRNEVIEVSASGDVLQLLQSSQGDLPLAVHHDLASRHGQTLVLNARTWTGTDGADYVVDGLFEVSDGVATDVWNVAEVLDPTGLTEPFGSYWLGTASVNGIDFGHANSVDVDDRGVWLLSFKHLDTLVAVVGDPAAADRGRVLWQIVGGARGVATDALALTADPDLGGAAFEHPHHARWVGPDRLTVLDNGRDNSFSRVIELTVDPEGGTARATATWPLGGICPVQSSAYRADDGAMVTFCTASRLLREFAPDGTLQRESELVCQQQGIRPPPVVRAIPMRFSAPLWVYEE